jgi:hypothetical protein
MEVSGTQENILTSEAKYFETYEVKPYDLEILSRGIENVSNSKLFEEEVLDNIRFVTYDSKSLYIFTRGEHATNDRIRVEEVPSTNKTRFKIFKTVHSGYIGRNRDDYRGANSTFFFYEIDATAVNAKKFPNQAVLYWPEIPQEARESLDTVRIAPYEPFEKINKGRFGYLTDVIFHEAGHIEKRRLESWQEGEGKIETFPSQEQKERFLSMIQQTKVFPKWITDYIIENITTEAIDEMYPMLIDREAAKRYDPKRFDSENITFQNLLIDLQHESANHKDIEQFKNSLQWGHTTGRLLVRVLEEQFSDFGERKQFVRSVLERKTVSKHNANQH